MPENATDARNSGTTIRLMAGVAFLLPCASPAPTRARAAGPCSRSRPCAPGGQVREHPRTGWRLWRSGTEHRHHYQHTRGRQLAVHLLPAHLLGGEGGGYDTSHSPRPRGPDLTWTSPGDERRFGAEFQETADEPASREGSAWPPAGLHHPRDFSSAAFSAAGRGERRSLGRVTVGTRPRTPRATGPSWISSRPWGYRVEWRGTELTCKEAGLIGTDIDLGDALRTSSMVVLCARADGRSRIQRRLRPTQGERPRPPRPSEGHGADIEETPDGRVVRGGRPLKGTTVDSRNDHRILMAAAVAALVADGDTIISDGECHRISYPDFVQDMRSLGARMELIP